MRHQPDWDRFARRDWEKAPARLSLGEPVIPPEQAFRGLIKVSEPFRHGTRFRALPDVRFFVDDARLRAPGTLLPGAEDTDPARYVRRTSAQLDKKKFQLFVEQPFMLDFPLWEQLRRFTSGLLERVGVPVLPIISDISLGNFSRSPQGLTKRLHHSVLTLVLHGRMRVRLWEKLWDESPNETTGFGRHLSEATTLEAKAGDILYTPSRFWQLEECQGSCMAVRLWIPVQGSRPTDAVKDVVVKLMDQQLEHDHQVPYLGYPWKKTRSGAGAAVAPLVRAGNALQKLTHGEDLQQVLRVVWTRRVSACALEPAPPPREARPMEDGLLIHRATHLRAVRMQESPGEWIWAVNGLVFPVVDTPEAAQVLEALEAGGTLRVGELCRLARRAAQREAIRELLERLYEVRGIELASGTEG